MFYLTCCWQYFPNKSCNNCTVANKWGQQNPIDVFTWFNEMVELMGKDLWGHKTTILSKFVNNSSLFSKTSMGNECPV